MSTGETQDIDSLDEILKNLGCSNVPGTNLTEVDPVSIAYIKKQLQALILSERLDEARFIDANIIGGPRKVTTNERIKERIATLQSELERVTK